MRITRVKNTSGQERTYGGKVFDIDEEYYVPENLLINFRSDNNLLAAITDETADIGSGVAYFLTVSDRLNWLLGDENLPVDTYILSQPPFAEPTYRTKRNATSSLVSVNIDSSANVDFQLTEERYVSGGAAIVENAKIGDYFTAEVYDKDSVIPEAYRAALCESWPTVAKYVEKEWIAVRDGNITKHEIDTNPLTARITAGLYLRITYYAVNEGSTRRVGVNYYLTKKL